jgi:GTP:adenosylcobinamide-phosphate guanylyltransferase
VHAFLVGDEAHPRFEEIYQQTHSLVAEMKRDGYVPDIDEEVEE